MPTVPAERKDRTGVLEVAKVVGDDVEIYRLPLMVRKLYGADATEPSVRVSCGAVEEDTVSAHCGELVPMPTLPPRVTPTSMFELLSVMLKRLATCAAVALTLKATVLLPALLNWPSRATNDVPTDTLPELAFNHPLTSRSAVGAAIPIPTFPAFVTTKLVALEDPIANAGALLFVAVGLTESNAHGDDEPWPVNPAVVNVVVPVPPNSAKFAEIAVVDAPPRNERSVVVAFPGKRYAKFA
jgi:hypothetical protein